MASTSSAASGWSDTGVSAALYTVEMGLDSVIQRGALLRLISFMTMRECVYHSLR